MQDCQYEFDKKAANCYTFLGDVCMKTVNQADLKIKNRSRVLKAILTGAPISRTELCQITGLSKMSITNVVNELMADGIVKETDKVETATGRKPVNLELVSGGRYMIGLYISRDQLAAGLCDLTGCLEYEIRLSLRNETNQTLLEKVYEAVDSLLNKIKKETLIGIGVACIGPLDRRSGTILNPPNFYQINNLPLASMLSQRYAVPVCMDNDTNACAMAELYFGQARGLKNFIFLGVSNGIGAGIVVNEKLCVGTNGLAGEIGHITVDINGPRCSCGNIGCLELYACIHSNFPTLPTAEKEQKRARICKYLGTGCVSLINLFDPEVIYVGYRFASLGDTAFSLLRQEIKDRYIGRSFSEVPLKPCSFGENAPLYGAVALCVDRMEI